MINPPSEIKKMHNGEWLMPRTCIDIQKVKKIKMSHFS